MHHPPNEWIVRERPFRRSREGQMLVTLREMAALEAVMGDMSISSMAPPRPVERRHPWRDRPALPGTMDEARTVAPRQDPHVRR